MSPKKLLLVVPSIGGGGAQRVTITLLRHFDPSLYDLHLAVISLDREFVSEVPPNVKTYDLKAGRMRNAVMPLLRLIRDLDPDVIFSVVGYINLPIIIMKLLLSIRAKIVIREANTVSQKLDDNVRFPSLWKWLYKKFYAKADKIICQSDCMLEDLARNFKIPESKMLRIYNPIDIPAVRKKAEEGENPFLGKGSGPHLVVIGRLTYQKGMDVVIRAFPDFLKMKKNAQLWIVGAGPLENDLMSLRDSLGVREHVHFPGFTQNPYLWMKHADLFVLPSAYEGLPNVLLEAIACECPVIVIRHPGGSEEVMKLTSQENRFVDTLDWDDRWLKKPSVEVLEKLEKHFGVLHIAKHFSSVLNN